MGEEFLIQIFFHRNEGRETQSEMPMCVSQDGFSVLIIAYSLVVGGRSDDGTVLTCEPESGGCRFYRADGFPITLDDLKNGSDRPEEAVRRRQRV